MYCNQILTHVVREGDTLYHLAQYYQTTIPAIIAKNQGIDPYNLQVGREVIICPGMSNHMPNSNHMMLNNSMRLAWEQHIYWTRMLLISIAAGLMDQTAVSNRLLENPYDIARIFAKYYPPDVANTIARLLTEHLQIGAAIIMALRDGRIEEAKRLDAQWHKNADQMANAFSRINPYYNYDMLQRMLYRHLALTTKEVTERLAGNYEADIRAFNEVEKEAMEMADYFTAGIVQQFPQDFR